MITSSEITSNYIYKLLFIAICYLIGVSSIITYSFYLGHQMTEKYAPLVDAAMEIKLEATTAHLWFEEILSGDRDEDIKSVKENIENAKWYTGAMIHGGVNHEGVFLPVGNKNLEKQLLSVLQYLDEFNAITDKRYNLTNTGAGSEYDKKYDKLFIQLIQKADDIETALQNIIAKELKSYNFIYYFMLVSTILITIIVFILFYNYEKSKFETLSILKDSNDKLESTRKDLIETNELIKQLANTDKLTQLYNRLKIDTVLDRDIKRGIRYKTIFSIILLDIDSFKAINDTFGHDVGDYTLISIANLLKDNIRSIDLVGRFGGEEFLVICPETRAQDAYVLAEKLRVVIAENEFKTIGKKTCSFGVSEFMLSDTSKEDILKRADSALYEAKSKGKNKVVLF